MVKKILVTAILSTFFVSGAYSAEPNFKRISPWEVIIYGADTTDVSNIGPAENVTSAYSPEVAFKRIDPWTVIIERDTDTKVEAAKLTHAQYYAGFQPVMASHYPRFDFNNDAVLTREECREGMQQLDNS